MFTVNHIIGWSILDFAIYFVLDLYVVSKGKYVCIAGQDYQQGNKTGSFSVLLPKCDSKFYIISEKYFDKL